MIRNRKKNFTQNVVHKNVSHGFIILPFLESFSKTRFRIKKNTYKKKSIFKYQTNFYKRNLS